MSACDFTCFHYEEILDLINQSDYKVIFFNEAYSNEKELILRHDVDFDLEKAYKMALIENKHRIRATYFILITSPFYNIFDKLNSEYIRGILELGHQIGLHFDESFYGSVEEENIRKNVDSEVQILKDHFNTDIFAVSFHRPSQFILQSDIRLGNNLINTYDKSFFMGFKYISDSRRIWKDGCLCSYFEKPKILHTRIQALVHPVWWTDEDMSAQITMEKFLFNKLKHLDSEIEKNMQIYNKLF